MNNILDFNSDDIKDIFNSKEITEQVKQDLTKKLVDSILPNIKSAATDFVTQIKEQGKDETGWCKLRDLVILPILINGGLYITEKVLSKTLEKTTEN